MAKISRRAFGLAALFSLTALAGCGGGSGSGGGTTGGGPTLPPVAGTGNVSGAQAVFCARTTDKARALLWQMTLEEKVGQMLLVEQASIGDINNIERFHLGALLSGGGSGPRGGDKQSSGAGPI